MQGQAYDILAGGGIGDRSVPLWLAGLYLGSNTVLSVLQFYWFGKMIEAVRKRFGGGGDGKGIEGEKRVAGGVSSMRMMNGEVQKKR